MTQQGRLRRSSLEIEHPVPAAAFYQDGGPGFASSYEQQQGALSFLLSQQEAAGQAACNGGLANGYGGLHHAPPAAARMPRGKPYGPGGGGGACNGGFDAGNGIVDAEEPGPLPCLPRAAARGLGGPGAYGGAGAALFMQQQMQALQRCAYPGPGVGAAEGAAAGGRQPRPRRHSVTIGMLNEHQQQAAAAYTAAAAASIASQQAALYGPHSGGMPSPVAAAPGPSAGLGLPAQPPPQPPMGVFQQQHQHQQPGFTSPAKQQLQALNGMQAAAAAAAAAQHLGVPQALLQGGVPGLPQQQLEPPPPPALGGGSGPMLLPSAAGDLLDLTGAGAAYSLNAPRMPGAGSSRRHSWAPTSANGCLMYAHTLLQQQQQQLASVQQLGDARALFGLAGQGLPPALAAKQNGLARAGSGGFGNGGLLNGHAPTASGPPSSGAYPGLAAPPGARLPPGFAPAGDPAAEQQQQLAQRLLQLQQQASGYGPRLGGGPAGPAGRGLDPYAEPFVSQAPLVPPVSMPGLDGGPYGGPGGLGLGFDPDALGAAAAMYTPLSVNGVAVDTQLLVSPYADSWDVLGGAGGPLGQQQLAAAAAAAGGGALGLGMLPPLAGALHGAPSPPAGLGGVPAAAAKHAAAKGAPMRTGSSSSTSSGSAPVVAPPAAAVPAAGKGGAAATGSGAPGATAALAAAASMVASLPPQSKVCSDAPWDLKKAADEDARTLAAQQSHVQALLRALEHSPTLDGARAAAAAAAGGGEQPPGGASDAAERAQAALFSYQLPDSGADTWGGSAAAPPESTPGGGCISQEPSNKLFVGNIGWWVTEEDLLHWFSRYGTVINVKIMYNSRKMHKPKDKWRSREYGFIDYATPAEAARAIVWMDGVELPDLMKDTCGIIVQYAKPTSGGPGNGSAGGGSGAPAAGAAAGGCGGHEPAGAPGCGPPVPAGRHALLA